MKKLGSRDPAKIGPYDIVARLGSGGMGAVYLGTKGDAAVAIKVAHQGFGDDSETRTRFRREIETLSKISSPHVARIVDSLVDENEAWHAVEFVNGPTLKELVANSGPLSSEEWWSLCGQLRQALEAIHSKGVVHRDLKPSNVIMSDTGAKVIDFGVSTDFEATSITKTNSVAGSPAWLSPEQVEGLEVTPASDLFSLGALLTYAATGKSPWGQESTNSSAAIFRRILDGKPNLEGMDESQKVLVQSLMAEDPGHRTFEVSDLVAQSEREKSTKSAPRRENVVANSQIQSRTLRTRRGFWIAATGAALAFVAALTVIPTPVSTEAVRDESGVNTATPAPTDISQSAEFYEVPVWASSLGLTIEMNPEDTGGTIEAEIQLPQNISASSEKVYLRVTNPIEVIKFWSKSPDEVSASCGYTMELHRIGNSSNFSAVCNFSGQIDAAAIGRLHAVSGENSDAFNFELANYLNAG